MQENHNQNLQEALKELKSAPTVNIHGKNYTQVSTRINLFRKYFSDASLETEITYSDEFRVIIKASISIEDKVIATGFAEEVRSNHDSSINSTSMIEVCETSAIGRALANFGLGGSEYASSNEVETAISQQNQSTHHNHQYSQKTPTIQNTHTKTEDYSSLYNLGLTLVEDGRGNLIVVGDKIFEKKDVIKQAGFRWAKENRYWYKEQNSQKVA